MSFPEMLYSEHDQQQFKKHLGVPNPKPAQRYEFFLGMWNEWPQGVRMCSSSKAFEVLRDFANRFHLKHQWHYQIRPQSSTVVQVRFCCAEYTMLFKLSHGEYLQ